MKVLDIFVNITGKLEELLCGARWRLLRGLVTLGLAAALNAQELVNGVGLGRSLCGICFRLNISVISLSIQNCQSERNTPEAF